MPTLPFTVDSALLRELGERLVGKPHIALAELVKNGYDADASEVTIEFNPDHDRIEVRDNGHGMTFEQFRDFWMRIGTTHKGDERFSPHLKRPMTGSKGVGRLAVQFLAERLSMTTVSLDGDGEWLEANVNWSEAVQAGELTEAKVQYTKKRTAPPFECGTSIVLNGLKNSWDANQVQELAKELWWLQPPFRSPSGGRGDSQGLFAIDFKSSQEEFKKIFDSQMRAILGIWNARLVGKNENGKVTLSLEFAGEVPQMYSYDIASFPHNKGKYTARSNLNDGSFEVRIFNLYYRQPHGIKVEVAREYFRIYGGVHVYDGGFRLPYYGAPENDWLRIELDHARRLFSSELLPEELQPRGTEGLRFLPTLSRIFGVVNVDTASEPNLKIMITRDRLGISRK